MAQLSEITGIGTSSLELLEAAGIRDAEHLARQEPDFLVAELKKANDTLSIAKRPPEKAAVEKWISSAVDLAGPPEDGEPEQLAPVNYEASEEVAEMLASAPFAIPLPGKMMMENQLGVGDIPAGLLLNRYSGNLDVRIGEPEKPKTDVPPRRDSNISERTTARELTHHLDSSQIKAILPEPGTKRKRAAKSKDAGDEDRVALIRAPREKTNRGKSPKSRRFIRGVLHTHPWSLRVGAVFTLLLLCNLPLAIVSAFLLLLSRESPESFDWVPQWLLVFPIALPIIGIAYLIWGYSGKCRICTQKLFVRKGALKHIKAHRLRGLGFVIPLSLHLLLFSWFRCSSCGTPVRLKK